jgi:hypothetical protein
MRGRPKKGAFMVSVGSIIGGGFRLFREQRAALLIWSVFYIVFNVATSMLVLNVTKGALAGGSPGGFVSVLVIFYIGWFISSLIMTAAAFRAVVRPEAKAAGFLRLGGDELRLFALGLLWVVGNMILYFVLVLATVAIMSVLITALGNSNPAIFVLLLVILLPIYGLMIFFHIRLSPAIPLTILRRRIVIGEAWSATKGHFWKLFAGYLVIFAIITAVYLIFFTAASWGYVSALVQGGMSPRSFEAANQYQMRQQMNGISVWMVMTWIGGGLLGVFAYALWAGSVGTAALELMGRDGDDYAATFE